VGFAGVPQEGFAPHFGITVAQASDRKTFLAECKADEERGAFKTESQDLLTLEPNVEAVFTKSDNYPEGQTMKSISLAAFRRDHSFLLGGYALETMDAQLAKELEACARSFRFVRTKKELMAEDWGWKGYYWNPEYGIAVRTPHYGTAHGAPRVVANFSGGGMAAGQTIPLPVLQIVAAGNAAPATLLAEAKDDALSNGWRLVHESTWTTIAGRKIQVLEIAYGSPDTGVATMVTALSDGRRTFVLRGTRRLDDQAEAIGAELETVIRSFVCGTR
jgi:hypothetical protein